MSMIETLNATIDGQGAPTLVFVHGYGCDQSMWRFVAPAFRDTHRTVLYDLRGLGQADTEGYDFETYSRLEAHADDLGALLEAAGVDDAVVIGHSVGATIASLAARRSPDRIKALALVAPSPCFVNDAPYVGGFERENIDGLIDLMEQNFLGWTDTVTPLIAGQPADGAATQDLARSFCRTDPQIARHFGRVTFLADYRDEMAKVEHPALVLQVAEDALAPQVVGEWLSNAMKNAEMSVVDATGHCPHMTEPEKTTDELKRFLARVA